MITIHMMTNMMSDASNGALNTKHFKELEMHGMCNIYD